MKKIIFLCLSLLTMLLESRHSVVVMAKVERIAETSSRASSKATTLQHHHDKVGGECSVYQRRRIHPLIFSSAMAAMAGCSHVLCIQKFQVYAAMMTGNVINLGMAFAQGNMNEIKFRLSMIGSYFAGTVCARSIEKSGGGEVYNDKRHHKVVAPAAVAMFAIADRIPADHQKRKQLVLLSAAYGMVYATASQALNGTIMQLMTGHVTKLGTAVSDRLRNANAGHGTLPSFCILGSFVLGCTFGARIFVLLKQEQPIFTVIGVIYAILLLLFQ